ncbi:Nucleoid occlusion factor SlmA [Acinetobacter oleivorans]|nr:Nucleoid occlusion factor SlmA [Acinetobacter oleivorans]CAI3099403.1 Nucleoid occlusion factor SlmA [Acinetobacter oleivorans]CAI3099414.1 Nucleoid occlusion factor SlmA [Acinetobacter oleivorans]CAI3099442.1 Nucleoid occlusion factor SlmA [Acinetobacter oleivorans]CAI3119095.1 Nucleoid occlusion factor SlmA [Acinetobacter oleivorans]
MSTLNSNEASSYHHGNLREALLINGLKLLEATQGVDFSMRELTRMIGVSANAVYRHFLNKEELLTALAIYGFEQLLEAQAHVINDARNPQEGFLNSGKEYIYFAIKNPSLFKLMYGRFTVNQEDEKLKNMTNLFYTGMSFSAAAAFNEEVNTHKIQTVTTLAWSAVHGLSHLIIDGQFDHLTEDAIMTMIDDVINAAVPL